jgi:hypothetical protein
MAAKAALDQAKASLDAFNQELRNKDQEILELKTAGLPESEAEYVRVKWERDALAKQVKNAKAQFDARIRQEQAQRVVLEEEKYRQAIIKLFLDGDSEKGVLGGKQFGLTAEELEKCQSPYQMEALATQKRQAWFDKRDADLKRKEAELTAKERKESGAAKFDKSDATSGGVGLPERGTPEWRKYVADVRAGRIKPGKSG